jgi:uncharacterized protein YidB (DUF937 family)
MGLLDIAQELLGSGQASGAGDMVNTVLQALNGHAGGLDGALQSLQNGGLGDVVNSWIGTGHNLPITGEQLQSILGSGVVQELGAKLGISPADAAARMSTLLPGIVDHLTPNGEVPQGGLAGAGLELVKGLLARGSGA